MTMAGIAETTVIEDMTAAIAVTAGIAMTMITDARI
jgi:hypothetical protein